MLLLFNFVEYIIVLVILDTFMVSGPWFMMSCYVAVLAIEFNVLSHAVKTASFEFDGWLFNVAGNQGGACC